MDNYEALAYASMALKRLINDNKDITVNNLRASMLYCMDMYSEKEIIKKYDESK